MTDDLCYVSATELAPLIARRELSPVELTRAHLDRIASVNDALVAYLCVDGDRALAAARSAEAEIAAGSYRGPLHGIPVGYKDIYDVQGLPTTANSRVLAGNVAAADCVVAAKLRQAGTIGLGKLNTTEFASGDMKVFGEARNPWDTTRTTGGSSSGPGGALAAGLATLALGTDTGGSIRIPASFCGVSGIRPTYGRVSRRGVVPLSWSLDQAGPMARTVADLALLLRAMAGPGVDDPTAEPRPVPDYPTLLAEDLRGVRLGVPTACFFDNCHSEVLAGVRAAVETLRGLGASVEEVDLPLVEYGYAAQWAISYSESYAIHRANFLARSRDYGARFLHKIASGAFLTAEELVTANRLRTVITGGFVAALGRVDALLMPSTGHPANVVDGPYGGGDQAHLTRPVSLTGLPALSVPCGFTSTGLPIGLQVVGRAWEEGRVLGIGHAYQSATDWHRRRPPLAPGTTIDDAPAPTAPDGPCGPAWILDYARRNGLTFVEEADAAPVAASVAPVKEQLARGRERLDGSVEPPTRPTPTAPLR